MSNFWDSMANAFSIGDSGYEQTYGYEQPQYAGENSLSAQDIADIDDPTGHGVASAVPQSDMLLADSGMIKDKSWMHTGMTAALKGLSRSGLGGVGGAGSGGTGFASPASVSAKGDMSAINEINKMVKGNPPLQDLNKYAKLFG